MNKNILKQENILEPKFLIIIYLISLVFMLFLKDFSIFKPLTYYITSIHEVFHALATVLTGGNVVELSLHDHGGHVRRIGGWDLIISPAGYIGTAFIGSSMLYFSKSERAINIYLFLFSIISLITTIYYIDSLFNIWLLSAIILNVLILLSIKLHYTRFIGVFLSSLFFVDSLSDVKMYLLSRFTSYSVKTDADLLAGYIGLDFLSFPIALCFAFITILMYWFVFKLLIKDTKRKRDII